MNRKPIVIHASARQYPVSLQQTGIDRFTVTYGLNQKTNLTYASAARELGECIMHALSCDSAIDNRERTR